MPLTELLKVSVVFIPLSIFRAWEVPCVQSAEIESNPLLRGSHAMLAFVLTKYSPENLFVLFHLSLCLSIEIKSAFN